MKSFFIKIFMVFAAALCMLEGLTFVAFGLGRLSPEKVAELYSQLIAVPKALTTIAGAGLFFVLLGFILLAISSRTKPAPQMIEVEKEGKVLQIPQLAIKNFIMQIIEQSPCASDFSVDFERKDKEVEIQITTALDGVASIYEELNQMEDVLKTEIERVFEWKNFKFNFQLRGVAVDSRRKYFPSGEAQPLASQVVEEKSESIDETQVPLPEPEDEIPESQDEAPVAKSKAKGKGKPKSSSLLSKMLWGK